MCKSKVMTTTSIQMFISKQLAKKIISPVPMETILQKVSVCELQLEITEPDVSAKINLSNRICSVCKFPVKHGNTDQQEKKGN